MHTNPRPLITPKSAAIAALIAAGAAVIALGPLNPPPGPVNETTPSLTQIDTKLDQILLGSPTADEISAPFEVFTAPLAGPFMTSASTATLIAEGRIYVDSVSIMFGEVALFDGPGTFNPATREVVAGTWIARSDNSFSENGGSAQFTTTTTPVETIVENGLHAAWRSSSQVGYVTIRYKRLTEGASE